MSKSERKFKRGQKNLKTLFENNSFFTVPIDRPVILKRLYQLFNCLLDRRVLTWQFFVTRFELIINEVQNYDVHQKQLNESAIGLHNKESEPVSETSNEKPAQQKIRHPTETVIV